MFVHSLHLDLHTFGAWNHGKRVCRTQEGVAWPRWHQAVGYSPIDAGSVQQVQQPAQSSPLAGHTPSTPKHRLACAAPSLCTGQTRPPPFSGSRCTRSLQAGSHGRGAGRCRRAGRTHPAPHSPLAMHSRPLESCQLQHPQHRATHHDGSACSPAASPCLDLPLWRTRVCGANHHMQLEGNLGRHQLHRRAKAIERWTASPQCSACAVPTCHAGTTAGAEGVPATGPLGSARPFPPSSQSGGSQTAWCLPPAGFGKGAVRRRRGFTGRTSHWLHAAAGWQPGTCPQAWVPAQIHASPGGTGQASAAITSKWGGRPPCTRRQSAAVGAALCARRAAQTSW